jgi:hypothetical protein
MMLSTAKEYSAVRDNERQQSIVGMSVAEENWSTWINPVSVSICPPQIPYGLAWDWTQAFMVNGWQLTAYAMA